MRTPHFTYNLLVSLNTIIFICLCYNKNMSKKTKFPSTAVKPKDDIGIDEFPRKKTRKTPFRIKPKKLTPKEAKIEAKRNRFIIILIAALICGSLFFLFHSYGLLVLSTAVFVVFACIVGLAGLDKKKKAENYGAISLANGITLLIIILCYSLSYDFDYSVIHSDLGILVPAMFYSLFLPATVLLIIMSIVSIRHHQKSSHSTRALVLNIVGIVLSLIALTLPALIYMT